MQKRHIDGLDISKLPNEYEGGPIELVYDFDEGEFVAVAPKTMYDNGKIAKSIHIQSLFISVTM